MAIATLRSHVARALEFFERQDKYFGIGRMTPWDNEVQPPAPQSGAHRLDEFVGLKKVDVAHLVVPDEDNGTIEYRGAKWRVVPKLVEATQSDPVAEGSNTVRLSTLFGFAVNMRVLVSDTYTGRILDINPDNNTLTLDTPAPESIPAGGRVRAGALVEGARWVYVDAALRYDDFPIVTYRQVGLFSRVVPHNKDMMLSAEYSTGEVNEYTDYGVLEILDNRKPTPRDSDQKELLSLIIEF